MNTIHIVAHYDGVPVNRAGLTGLVDGVCRRFGVDGANVSVGIVDDVEIAGLNHRFLGRDKPTDCLSFDLSDGPAGQEKRPKRRRGSERVFDLIVNGQMAVREAARRDHSSEAELALYVVHALLHQLGFADAAAASAEKMHRMEDEILQHFGYEPVYNSDARPR